MRFEELRHQLDDALEFCASLGLAEAIKTGRFKEYKALIQRLCEIIQTYTLESLPTEIDQELRERNVEYVLSLTESLEFVGTLHFLKTCEQDVIYRKLQRILSGPLLPKDENENSNEPRNTLFELNLASKLWKAGLAPSIEMVADIEWSINDKQLLVECKRPFRNIRQQIKKAGKQLKIQLENRSPGTRGIIAVSLSKVLNPGDKLFVYLEEPLAKDALSRKLQEIAEKEDRAWRTLGMKIIGILFHVVTASLDRKNNKYSLGEQFNAHPLAQAGSADYVAFRELCAALEKLQH